jgi:two-component system, sensor histidine kinase and response regulator
MRVRPSLRSNPSPTEGFLNLRIKSVLFISLIIIVTCSGLSWYFVTQRIQALTEALQETGSILAKNLAHNSRYALFTEDEVQLNLLIDGEVDVKDVVYVVMTVPDHKILAARTKGKLVDYAKLRRSPEAPLYPDVGLASTLFGVITTDAVIHPFIAPGTGKAGNETIYDFAVPVLRHTKAEPFLPPSEAKVYGVVQIGLTQARMQLALTGLIWNIALITGLIIAAGIACTVWLAGRITTPLRSLATVARKVAEGDLTAYVEPTTRDEVGQLTAIFNDMTKALQKRDQAISTQIDTIRRQVKQLSALNQAGAAITSTLDLDRLLTSVLQLLIETVGFTRMLLMLYDSERQVAYGARTAGVPEDVAKSAQEIEIPVQGDEGFQAELLIRGKAVLVPNIDLVTDRIYPPLLRLMRQVGGISFVCAPFKSQQRIHGFIAADRGTVRCTQEDLDLITTIASDVAVAIDNAKAYHQLEQFTQTLEQRVRERTEELQSANVRLRELDRLKSAFVSIVSHELRTPITSIKGYVENMLDGLAGSLTDKQLHYLTRVRYNTDRLTRMINDLLDLSRIEAGRLELRLEAVALPVKVHNVVEGVQRVAGEKGLTVRQELQAGLPLVRGDRDKLYQILTNLIQNAIQFTPKGGEVVVRCEVRDPDYIQVCVADTGCGIPPHELDKIFDRFFRGETVSTEARGAGLGLAITKSLVELHGGRIWVESTVGEGSQFYFTLPIAPTQS